MLLGAVLSACVAPSPTPEERVGATRSALTGGRDDDDPADRAYASAIVELREVLAGGGTNRCSATFVTPLVLLTAAHCIDGGEGGVAFGPRPPVCVFPPRSGLVGFEERAARSVTRLGRPLVASDGARDDLALVFMDEAVLRSNYAAGAGPALAWWTTLLEIEATRPLTTTPIASVEGETYTFRDPVGVAGWGGPLDPVRPRQVAFFDPPAFLRRDGEWWRRTFQYLEGTTLPATQGGDSGGSLFAVPSPRGGDPERGPRAPFGVVSNRLTIAEGGSVTEVFDRYADLTRPELVAWIAEQARDRSRTPGWLARHGKPSSMWVGEVDYTGPCRGDDRDCDHWLDVHDNCPDDYNPDQADADDDGVGDACDNCRVAYNPTQANCNALAERARLAEPLGDACDPVPCPLAELGPAQIEQICTPNPPGPGGAASGEQCIGRYVRRTVIATPIGSHARDAVRGPGDPDVFTVVPNVTSHARFCQSAEGFNCRALAVIEDDQLTFAEVGDNPLRPWHAVRLGDRFGPRPGLPPLRGQTFSWSYGATRDVNTWFAREDNDYWFENPAAPRVPLPSDYPACLGAGSVPGTCLEGSFWLHADTSFGAMEHAPRLANHYFDWRPDPLRAWCPIPLPPIAFGTARSTAAQASGEALAGELVWRSLGEPRSFDLGAYPRAELVVSALGGLLALQPDGRGVALSALDVPGCAGTSIPTDVRGALTTRRWTSAVEPLAALPGLDPRVMAVALSPDGTTLLDVALDTGGELRSLAETEDTLSARLSESQRSATSPPPRAGAASVLSRAVQGVFVVGGEDAAGAPTRDVWFQALGAPWRDIPLSGAVRPERVLAATFGFADGHLWIVDEIDAPRRGRGPSRRLARLLRVDVASGEIEVVIVAPRHRPDLRPYLSVDPQGAIVLTLAGERRFVSLRLEARRGRHNVSRVRTERGKLVRPPIFDEHGVSYVVERSGGTLGLVRRDALVRVRCDDDREDAASAPNAPGCGVRACEALF